MAMIFLQIIHEEPCREAMELKVNGERKTSRNGPRPKWSEDGRQRGGRQRERDPSDERA